MKDDVFTSVRTAKEYNIADWTPVTYDAFAGIDIRTWFRKHCNGRLYITPARLYFSDEEAAVFFSISF